jgi:hypothetical protein
MTTISNRSILIVHGRDFKPAEDALMEISMAALRAGVERDYPESVDALDSVSKDIAYFGDLTNDYLESLGKHYDATLDLGDRNNALTGLKAVQLRKRFGIRQYDCLPGKSALREFAADILAPLLGAISLTMPLLRCVSRDCAEYLAGKSDYAEKVRERVRNKLCEKMQRGDKILLMTHGVGVAIAYDVLWELSHEVGLKERYEKSKVDLWLTLGAPLGDHNIRKRLRGAKEKNAAKFPTNVISWHNVSAEDDYTCHDNTLADDFKKMMDHRLVSTVHDYHVYNLAVRYGRSNPHSSVGYYIHPRVSKIVIDWIKSDTIE